MPTVTLSITDNTNDGAYIAPIGWSDDFTATIGGPVIVQGKNSASGVSNAQIALRFVGVTIPQGATISQATLTTTLYADPSRPDIPYYDGIGPYGDWVAEAVDNADVLSASHNPSTATRTTAASSIVNNTGDHDVTTIVQEIINRAGWVSGNAIFIYGDNTNTVDGNDFYSRDYADGSNGPVNSLSITYVEAAPPITWNPSDKSSSVTLSNGNLTAKSVSMGKDSVRATLSRTTGKFYFEASVAEVISGGVGADIGLTDSTFSLSDDPTYSEPCSLFTIQDNFQQIYINALSGWTNFSTAPALFVGQTVQVAVDLDNHKIWFGTEGTWIGGSPDTYAGDTILTQAEYYPFVSLYQSSITGKFKASDFKFAPPTGFSAWDSTAAAPSGSGFSSGFSSGFVVPSGTGGSSVEVTPIGVGSTATVAHPGIGQRHALTATGLTSTALLGKPALKQKHALSPNSLTATATVGHPSIRQIHSLLPSGISSVADLAEPALGQKHALSPSNLASTAVLTAPTIGQTHKLGVLGISSHAFIDPVPLITPSTGSVIRVYTAGQWVDHVLKEWDGSAWIQRSPKVRTGGSWA